MDSNGHGHRRNRTLPHPTSIPLQDLHRPPETPDGSDNASFHRRTMSERVTDGMTRINGASRSTYTPLGGTPTTNRPNTRSIRPVYRTPQHSREGSRSEDEFENERSPLADRGRFSEAMSWATFGTDDALTGLGASLFSGGPSGVDTLLGESDSITEFPEMDYEESIIEVPHLDDDRARLTDERYLQASSSLAPPPSSPAQKSDRSRGRSVRFSMAGMTPKSRLGDDLAAAEAGHSPGHRSRRSTSRSLSPSPLSSSPLHRASTVVRKMSQRIVNLSNEPEHVDDQRESHDDRRSTSAARPSSDTGGLVDLLEQQDTTYDRARSLFASSQQSASAGSSATDTDWVRRANPLKGKSLGIFAPDNRLRTSLCDVLVHPATEGIILVLIFLQTVLLAIQAGPSFYDQIDENGAELGGWGRSWFDYALLALFGIYTIEVFMRVIVSGFILNPVEYSTINRSIGWKIALRAWWRSLFALHEDRKDIKIAAAPLGAPVPGSILRSFTQNNMDPTFHGGARQQARIRLGHRAFLRHSFARLDFLAVVSFWISFVFDVAGIQSKQHVYAFRMLSSLRILRLLAITNGTHVILRSLKKAAPLLLNVALLIGFFWLLFGIIGVQAFKSSLRRTCVWTNSTQFDSTQDNNQDWSYNQTGNFQFCGGSVNSTGERLPWYRPDGSTLGISKGYLCPPNSFCIEGSNPYNGTVSFDNIAQSLELVFVIMTGNTYSDLMYYLSDSEHLIACVFFAAGVIIFLFWLINLLIAVITTSFQVIREESATSAFSDKHDGTVEVVAADPTPKTDLAFYYKQTYWLWNAVILYGICAQGLRSANMSPSRRSFVDVSESVVTLILLFEIILRFVADWRHFHLKKSNWFDLALALITAIIQLPGIHDSGTAYDWLTVFQILRIYRLVMAVKLTRELIILVVGNVKGLANLFVFVFLLTFLVSIFASQLFRGSLPEYDNYGNVIEMNFSSIWLSFLGTYQVLSSENWTSLLYSVTAFNNAWNTAWIGAIFFILWFTLGFFVVLNMFIAVIQENFDVSEDSKRVQQVRAFLQSRELGNNHTSNKISLSAALGLRRRQDPLAYGNAMMDQLLRGNVVKEFIGDVSAPLGSPPHTSHSNGSGAGHVMQENQKPKLVPRGPSGYLRTLRDKFWAPRGLNPFYSKMKFSDNIEGLDPTSLAKEAVWARDQMRKSQRDYLQKHRKYNVSLFVFGPNNRFRRLCQKLVSPGRGVERIEGEKTPSKVAGFIFSAFLYMAIVAMVLIACVTTPLYQREYFSLRDQGKYFVGNWFTFVDLGFAVLFTIEAIIRVVADGLFFSPHAYYRTSWGIIDAVVLITLWINVSTALYNIGEVSRAVGAFKALRALRLLNISDNAKNTFHAVIVRGGWKIISAAFVSLSLLVPFAIFGLNLFNGRMETCNVQNAILNDPQLTFLNNCINEYSSSPFGWNVVAPAQVANPYYNFDNFGNALFILFQIVSQEGWVDVMFSAMSIRGPGLQPQYYANQGNAVFFIVFNIMGSVFVLTLFISVFMRNYTEQTGVAFLTAEQRSWLELRKRLKKINPSKRLAPGERRGAWREWCYRMASKKTGTWARFVTTVLIFHLILLCLEFYPSPGWWELTRTCTFFVLLLFYMVNIAIRITGLSWTRFRRSSWDLYSLVSVTTTFAVTLVYIAYPLRDQITESYTVWRQIQKLLLVSVVLLLIPRNNQLDQLFKTAATTLPAVTNLLATWCVLFLVFAIALTQTFGLTRFGNNESDNINFRSVPKALILLFRMSTGEGWNAIMEDFASITYPNCNTSENFLENDCGSPNWARALFIAWNILSMYIFVNMFISLIFESFSYVYQRSSGIQSVSRDEIRRFKHAWAEVDPKATGSIAQEDLGKLLKELSGVFDMRIYPAEFSISELVRDCEIPSPYTESPLVTSPTRNNRQIDIAKLNARLREMPIQEIRERRRTLELFYQEMLLSARANDKRIKFDHLLMELAHHKIIDDNKALRLEEFLRRTARLGVVEGEVRRKNVRTLIANIHYRQQYFKEQNSRRASRMTSAPDLPTIIVQDEDDSSRASSRLGSLRGRPALTLSIPANQDEVLASGSDARVSPTSPGLRNRGDPFSPNQSPTRPQMGPTKTSFQSQRSLQLSPTLSPYRASSSLPPSPMEELDDVLGGEGGYLRNTPNASMGVRRSLSPLAGAQQGRLSAERAAAGARRNTAARGDARDVLDVLEGSAWGESMRRSMTSARRSTRVSSSGYSGGSGGDGPAGPAGQ